MRNFTLALFFSFLSLSLNAQTTMDPSSGNQGSLLDAMSSLSLAEQTIDQDNRDQEADDSDTCLWGGWLSTKSETGECQAAFLQTVYNDPYIKNFGPTYNASLRCGAANLYRCNPVIFGKASSGRDSSGYCVNIPQVDSALLMNACKSAAAEHSQQHLEDLKKDPELLANYIAQSAEIALQCRQGGSDCNEFIQAVTNEVRPALTCHQSSSLFPYMGGTMSQNNLSMIDQLTGSLGSEYNTYIENLLRNREAALTHNRELLEQAIAQYSNSDEVRRMQARLTERFTVRLNKQRRVVGSKLATTSIGRCLMYVKFGLVSGGFMRYPGTRHARDFGPVLRNSGFTNLMDTPGFEDMTPENAPPGAVIVYRGGDSGHIEVKMADGRYGSDFVSNSPISARTSRRVPIGIYVKIPTTIDGMVEVPNE